MKIFSQHIPVGDSIYEFGSYQVSDGLENDLRPLFTDRRYVGSDFREGPGVDLVLDLHDIELPNEIADCVICLDTLEHVEFPRRALSELYRILKPNGIGVISSVFNFPIHNYPNDFWRFTPEGFKSLLYEFDHKLIFSFGRSDTSPQCIVGIGFKGDLPQLEEFKEDCKKWEEWNSAVLRKMLESEAFV